MGLVSYSDVKKHLNLSSDSDAGEVIRFIAAATDVIEQRIGSVTAVSYTEEHQASTGTVVLNHAPVISVDSVTEYGYGVAFPLSAQSLGSVGEGYSVVDLSVGLLRRRSFGRQGTFHGPVVVTYTAGRGTVPAAVQTAALLLIGHMWETQRGASPLPAVGGEPPLSVRYAGGMPPFVADLLDGYDARLPGIA